MDEAQGNATTDSSALEDLSSTPKGFLALIVFTMLVVGSLSWLFLNAPFQAGVAVAEEVRAAYWGASIAAGIGLAGAWVAIVLARRSQQTSLEVLRLERRAERRELDSLLRTESINTAEVLRELGDTCFAFVSAWSPVQRDMRPQLVKNWLLGPTAPNQDVDLNHLTNGYTPSARVQELALEAARGLSAAVDQALATPTALSAMRTQAQKASGAVENSDVRDNLMKLHSWLANNLRDFPASDLIGLSVIASDSISVNMSPPASINPLSDDAATERVAMGKLVLFVGTLIARHHNEHGVKAAGVDLISHLFSLIPDRESLATALTEHFLESAALETLDRSAIEESVDRVLRAGGVGFHLLTPHSAAMSLSADAASKAAQERVDLRAPPIDTQALEDVLASSIRLFHQAYDKVGLANALRDKSLQLEALTEKYRALSLIVRFFGPNESRTLQAEMWEDIWTLGQRAFIQRSVARTAFQDIARSAWMLSMPIAPHDGDKIPEKLVELAEAHGLTFQRDIKSRLQAIKDANAGLSNIARVAQLFALVLEDVNISPRAMTEILTDLDDEGHSMPTQRHKNIEALLIEIAIAHHPHLEKYFGEDAAQSVSQ